MVLTKVKLFVQVLYTLFDVHCRQSKAGSGSIKLSNQTTLQEIMLMIPKETCLMHWFFCELGSIKLVVDAGRSVM